MLKGLSSLFPSDVIKLSEDAEPLEFLKPALVLIHCAQKKRPLFVNDNFDFSRKVNPKHHQI